MRALLAVAAAALGAAVAQGQALVARGHFSLKDPAFMKFLTLPGTTQPSFFASQFGPLYSGTVARVDHLDKVLDTNCSSAAPAQLASGFTWPNDFSFVPASAFGRDVFLVPDGFLVPFHSTGNVYAIPTAGGKAGTGLAASKSGWFYHRALVHDVDGDGDQDILTARATVPMAGAKQGQLVWLENPGGADPLSQAPWADHVLASGPDVMISLHDFDPTDGTVEVIACQFFSSKLRLYSLNGTGAVTFQRDIDAAPGPTYMSLFADVDGDGADELVVGTHVGGDGGGIYAYTVPADFRTGAFAKSTLATGFNVTEGGFNQAAPGMFHAFHPHVSDTGRPWFLVAGDGSQRVHLLAPAGQSGSAYTMTTVLAVDGVVGDLAVGDVDGDGWADFFAPNYDKSLVYAFSFAQA